jgi:hypothetical protein
MDLLNPPPISAASAAWLAEQTAAVAAGDRTALGLAFAGARRHHPDAEAARVALVLAIPSADPDVWLATLDRLFATAGLEESVTLYRALPRYPHPDLLRLRAAVGIRSSMQTVFEAVALDNSYPGQWLAVEPFNQMVLKAFFCACDPQRIVGLRQRVNPALGGMLADYCRERVIAGRPVPLGLDEVVTWCAP